MSDTERDEEDLKELLGELNADEYDPAREPEPVGPENRPGQP